MNNTRILLAGPAGSGKTHHLLDDFERELRQAPDPLAEDFFFILPSAEHTERITTLMLQRGVRGFFHRRVTTLTRLIPQVFGVGEEGVAGNVTRFLILKQIFDSRPWDYFREVQDRPGFLNLMLGFIAELKESLVSPDLFRARMNAMKTLEPDIAAKYEALAAIYEAYEEALKARGLRDRSDAWWIYRERKEAGKIQAPRFRKLWLDGFFDFSAAQFAYLQELCEMADEVTVTLTLDGEGKRPGLFEPVQRTAALLQGMGFELREVKPAGEESLVRQAAARIFSEPAQRGALSSSKEITFFEAIGVEGEVEMIARTIQHMHKSGRYRFSDFAVLLRHIGEYETVIRSVFERYGVPVEIHERERLGFSPLIQVLVRLFKIYRDGWKMSDLMEFLKSSYVRTAGETAKDYEWVAALEHAAMAAGVFKDREAWFGPWGAEEKNERLKPIAELEDRLRAAGNMAEVKRLAAAALEKTFGIFQPENLDYEYVRRDAASHRRLLAILDEIDASFTAGGTGEGSSYSFDAMADRFFRLVDLDLYSLHYHDKNRVQVYNVSLARQKEYKVVFLAGLLEKKFPVQIKEDPLLSDWERRLFNDNRSEAVLKERLPSQNLERYLFYLAMTRASYRLFLSYPKLDLEGRESLPSSYVREVRSLFSGKPQERRQELARPYPELDECVTRRDLEMSVLGSLWHPGSRREEEPELLYLFNRLLEGEESRRRIRAAFYEVRTGLSDARIREAAPFRPLKTSASRLEEYGKCSFKYFARQVLCLHDPEEDLNVTRRGTVLHEVLENCFRRWAKDPACLADMKKAEAMAEEELKKALANNPILSFKKYRYDLEIEDLKETLRLFLEYELERLGTSPLRPHYFEYDFGGEGAAPAFEVDDGERKILIRGKIDRIDVDEKTGTAAVLDYKRTASFKKDDLELGIALQLAIYSLVAEKQLGLKPAAAELYSLKGLDKKGFYNAAYTDLFPGLSNRRMILDEKQFRAVLDRSLKFIRKYSRGMEAAQIEVRPRECLSYCPYSTVCRIEKWRLPLILEEIRADDAREGLAEGENP